MTSGFVPEMERREAKVKQPEIRATDQLLNRFNKQGFHTEANMSTAVNILSEYKQNEE